MCTGTVITPENPFSNIMTLADALAFTIRTHLVGFSTMLAWVETTRGVINIFGAEVGGAPRALTNFSADDGATISGLRAIKTAKHPSGLLIWSYPTDEANPLSNIAPSSASQIMVLPLGQPFIPPIAIGPHRLVTVTPDGTRALYAYSSSTYGLALCELPTEGTAAVRLDVSSPAGPAACGGTPHASLLLRVRSGELGRGGATWSGDGRVLAVSVLRFDHGFIGVWRRGTTRLRWVAPSLDTDAYPVWSADGDRLAFIRLREGSDEHGVTPRDRNDGPPFAIFVAEMAAPGSSSPSARLTAREVYREWQFGYPGTGENGYGGRPLLWAAGDSVLLTGSERSGYLQVVAVGADGDVRRGTNTSTALTPRGCEVQDWRLSPDSTHLYVAHGCDDVDSLGVMRVDVRSGTRAVVVRGTPTQVAGMSGDEDGGAGMLPLDGGGIAYIASTYNASTSVWLSTSATAPPRMLAHPPPPAAVAAFRMPKMVTFPSSDGLFTLHAQLFEAHATAGAPRDRTATKPRPAVLFTHGGAMRQMYGAMHYSRCYAGLYALNQARGAERTETEPSLIRSPLAVSWQSLTIPCRPSTIP